MYLYSYSTVCIRLCSCPIGLRIDNFCSRMTDDLRIGKKRFRELIQRGGPFKERVASDEIRRRILQWDVRNSPGE